MSELRVLFVDDSDLDVMLAVRALRSAGVELSYARVDTANALREQLATGAWDAVVCDHQMPAFDALSALRVHRASQLDVPFLILSGAMPDELAVAALREGARDFLHKEKLARLAPALLREVQEARNRVLLRQTQDSVDRLLHYDQLTGLPNRDALQGELASLLVRQAVVGFVLVDVVRFRRLAQSNGVLLANRVLRGVAARLQRVLADHAGLVVARMGPDRFALVLPQVQDSEALTQVGELLQTAFLAPLSLGEQSFRVRLWQGGAISESPAKAGDEARDGGAALLARAEAALAAARRQGADSLVVFSPDMALLVDQQLAVAGEVQSALADGAFRLVYQPQQCTASGRVRGVEALLRWARGHSGAAGGSAGHEAPLLSPADFLMPLVDSGQIMPVGAWVMGSALKQLADWQEAGLGELSLTINLSAVELLDGLWLDNLRALLDEHGVAPERVEIDLTGGVAPGQEEAAIAQLQAAKNVGVRLAWDQFGAGYLSLAYLEHLPLDAVKIHRGLLRDADAGGSTQSLEATMCLARAYGLDATLVGVERAEQAAWAKAGDCQRIQGRWVAPPMAGDALTDWLRKELAH